MKTIFPTVLLTCGMIVTNAATNELTGLMQKGLFGEEANHNLTAAIEAYQRIINRFDESRPVAATAIFRLGECYRKQGKTNEAANCYQRIIKEFSDQNTLLTLSEQNLGGLGARAADTRVPTEQQRARVAEIKKLPKEQQRLLVQQASRNPVLDGLMGKLLEQQQKLATDSHTYGSGHPIIVALKENIALLEKQIDEQVATTLLAWETGLEKPLPQAQALAEGGIGAYDQASADSESAELKRIQTMIKESPDLINAHDPASGATPLHLAAAKGFLRVAQFLVAHGADIEAKDSSYGGRTPLHYAANAGHKTVVDFFLSKGANVGASDRYSTTPLHLAAERGFAGIAELLLAHGADVNAKASQDVMPLHFAVASGNRALVQLLLDHKADINAIAYSFGGSRNDEGTPVHVAVEENYEDILRLLIERHANVNTFDYRQLTPLDRAVTAGRLRIATLLLDGGADPDLRAGSRTESGLTALHHAVIAAQKDCVALLLSRKADPNAKSGQFSWNNQSGRSAEGYTALLMATRRLNDVGAPYKEIIRFLLEGKADPNIQSVSGDTPLLVTLTAPSLSSEVRSDVLYELLEHRAKPDLAYSTGGSTPLIIAAADGKLQCVKELLAHHANPNLTNSEGATPLHYLAQNCGRNSDAVQIASILLEAGADPNAQGSGGSTPLSLVNGDSGQCGALAELLRQHGGLKDVPDFKTIRLSRAGVRSVVIWRQHTNQVNQFTLFETLAYYYWAPTSFPVPHTAPVPSFPSRPGALSIPGIAAVSDRQHFFPFPDFSRVTVSRPKREQLAEKTEVSAQMMKDAETFECANNQPLQFGDVIEIPEREHTIVGPPMDWTAAQSASLRGCLTQTVTFSIKSKTVQVPSPAYTFQNYLSPAMKRDEVSALLTSRSDLARVKVKRTNRATGKSEIYTEDVQSFWDNRRDPADDLWLRDGDVVEVLEKN